MCAATGNDGDCRKGIALGFCISTSLLASRRQQTSTHLQSKNTLGLTAIPESLSPICPSTIILLATGPLKPPLAPGLAGPSPVLLYFR